MLMKLSSASVWALSLLTLTAAAHATPGPTTPSAGGNGLCMTPACVEAAQAILHNMNPTADPCEDFYQFACGGFDEREQIPEDGIMVSAFQYTQKRSEAVVHKILEADPSSLKGPNGKRLDAVAIRILKKSQALYKSCMNETHLTSVGRQPLFQELQQLISKVYPAPGSQLASAFPPNKATKPPAANRAQLSRVLAHFVRLGVDTFLVFSLTEDPSNATMQGVALDDGGLTLPTRELYLDDSVTTQLQGLIEQMLTMSLGPLDNKGSSNVTIEFSQVAQDVVAFEAALAKIATDPQDLTDSRGLRLSSELRRPLEMFHAVLSGANPEIPPQRSETCVQAASTGVGAILGHFYIAQVFPPSSKKLGEEMIEAVRQVYLKDLEKVDWLDAPTRANAMAKLKKTFSHVGYSTFGPDAMSAKSISNYYKALRIEETDFYGNQVRVAQWTVGRQLSQAGKKTDKRVMLSDPQVVDALFNHMRNEMIFPAGILQRPFFVESNPEYLNFGGMGVVAGHELTHGLDSNGRTYDAIGTHVDWWTNSTATQFLNKTQCFKDQYAKFTVPNPTPGGAPIHVNGQLTLSENLADNGGVQKSYATWSARLASDPQGQRFNNQRLAGLESYTREQLFFVAYGQLWCAKVRPKMLVQYVLTNTHSPPEARVNGAMQNSREFARAFGCKASAPMNPVNKCVIW
ncbi:hypothetical protein BGZ73_005116 [Actinomortierella ambigua]|nr:hypothetical protein BGZ73_005116 [Actinomortierella ambigua]